MDGRHPRPIEALTPHADTVADRSSVRLHEIEIVMWWVDNDRTGRLAGLIPDGLAQIGLIDRGQFHRGYVKRLVVDLPVDRRVLQLKRGVWRRHGRRRW